MRRKPAIGWIRGDQGFDPSIYKELDSLRKENESLKKQLERPLDEIGFSSAISHGNDVVIIRYAVYKVDQTSGNRELIDENCNVGLTWDNILKVLTDNIYSQQTERQLDSAISNFIADTKVNDTNVRVYLDDDLISKVRFQFEALGLILLKFKRDRYGEDVPYWEMTEKGRKYISRLNAVQRVAAKSDGDTHNRDDNSVSSAKSQ